MQITELTKRLPADTARALLEREAWLRGNLSYLVLDGAQRKAYDFVKSGLANDPTSASPFVINARRGARKSFLLAILCFERLMAAPGTQALLIGPFERQTLQTLEPALQFLCGKAPRDLRPERIEGGTRYNFRNPAWDDKEAYSTLRLLGAKESGRSLRGLRADVIALDEFALFSDSSYVLHDIVGPIFSGRDKPLFLIASTPPPTLGHPFVAEVVPQAELDGRYIRISASSDTAFDDREEARMLSIFRSKDTVAWRREMECELLADTSVLAIPSFTTNRAAIVRTHERPQFFFPFTGADLGFTDPTSVLFTYVDYSNQLLVVEDEIFGRSIGTHDLVSRVQGFELKHFGESAHFRRLRRWADCTPRELDDLRRAGLPFTPARSGSEDRWDKATGLARLESFCADKRLRVHPRCKALLYQLENSVRNTGETDIARDPSQVLLGHADALWSLSYLLFNLQHLWLESPFPFRVAEPQSHGHLHKYFQNRPNGNVTDRDIKITEHDDHIHYV